MGLYGAMIKLIRINESYYINADEIEALRITTEALTLYMKDGRECSRIEIKVGSVYYNTARKALSV